MSELPITTPHCAGHSHGGNGAINLVLLHDEEYPLSDSSAEQVAKMFSGACPPRRAGCAQYVVDRTSFQHTMADSQLSYNAPPNTGTLGIERDGYASYSLAQWNAAAAQQTTCNVAALTAELLVRHSLPVQWVTAAGQRAGQKGVSDHRSRSQAFGQSSHSDPGPAFPREQFMALVLTAVSWVRDPKAFQAAHGLTADGDVGPATLLAMGEALFGGAPAGLPAPGNTVTPAASYVDEPATGALGQWYKGPRVAALQAALGISPADGFFGPNTSAVVRQFQGAHGLTVDGLAGDQTMAALNPAPPVAPPAPPAHEQLSVDGDFGPNTIKRLQEFLGVNVDGDFGPNSKKALQHWVGVNSDGVVGPMTIRALQRAVGAGVDGNWGPDTTRHLQTFLNGH